MQGTRLFGVAVVVVAIGLVTAGPARADEKVDRWIKALEAPKPEQRVEAAFALAGMGEKAAPAVKALTKTMQDKFYKVRAACAIALGKIGPKATQSTDELLAKLTDLSPSVRRAAAKALSRMGPTPARRAVEALMLDLDHKLFKVRATAAEVLGSMGLTASAALQRLQENGRADKSATARKAAKAAAELVEAAVKEYEAEQARLKAEAEAKAKAEAEALAKAKAAAEAMSKAAREAQEKALAAQKKAEEEAKRKAAEANMRKCVACETKIPDPKATTCPSCGDSLIQDKKDKRECPGCGQKVVDGDLSKCPDCETALPQAGEESKEEPEESEGGK
jgi:HEAT repeat protein